MRKTTILGHCNVNTDLYKNHTNSCDTDSYKNNLVPQAGGCLIFSTYNWNFVLCSLSDMYLYTGFLYIHWANRTVCDLQLKHVTKRTHFLHNHTHICSRRPTTHTHTLRSIVKADWSTCIDVNGELVIGWCTETKSCPPVTEVHSAWLGALKLSQKPLL